MKKEYDGLGKTEKRVLQSIHLRGTMGRMGSMSLKGRREMLCRLIDGGWLSMGMRLTEKGIRESRGEVLCR